jgi:hypothetical protein
MGAWVLDYLTNWVGEHGFVLHCDIKYRGPAHTGDVTYLNGSVTGIGVDAASQDPIAVIEVVMTNQRGEVMAKGPATVRLPRP